MKDTKKGNLIKILESILKKESQYKASIKKLEKKMKGLEVSMQSDIQKFGLVRFNPFSELGGDHSFSLAMLDGHSDGFILTGLHTRERTRVYLKSVKGGKSKYDLSKEEVEALQKAQK